MGLTKKIFAFSSLYVSEGIEGAISSVVLPLYLAKLGYSAGIVGLAMSITTIPWVIKLVWGIGIDAFANKGRKPFILGGGILGALMNFIIFLLHPSLLPLIIGLIFLARVGIATLDTSTDALAISITTKRERGKITGAEFMGQLTGYSLGSIYFTRLAVTNFSLPFLAAGIFILMFASAAIILKDSITKPSIRRLKDIFEKREMWFILAVILLINLPGGLIGIAAYYMKANLSIPKVLVGEIMTVAGVINAIGSFIGGDLSDKFGRKKIMALSLIFYGIFIMFAVIDFVPFYIISSIFTGALTSAFCAYGMDITKKKVAATEYAVLTSTANFGYMIGMSVSGYILEFIGSYLLIVSAISIIPGVILIKFLPTRIQ